MSTTQFTLTQKLIANKLNGFIVTNPINIYYLCGFKGISPIERESILIFNPKPTLITTRLYQNDAHKLASTNLAITVVNNHSQYLIEIKKYLSRCKRVGFESNNLKFAEYEEYKKLLTISKLIPENNLIEDIRLFKSKEELQNIRYAQKISQKAFYELIKTIKIGQAESEIADNLAKIIKSEDGHGSAFDPIIASGKNSSFPHYVTGNKKIKKGEILLLDFGAKYKSFCADLSRTIFIGRTKDEQKNIYNVVQKAQDQAISKIKNNIKAVDIYRETNNIFKKQQLEKFFIHSLGHDIGLEVHEKPSLSSKSKDTLTNGMVFSIEPGLYFPSWGGIRIEDLVTINNGRTEIIGKKAKFIEI